MVNVIQGGLDPAAGGRDDERVPTWFVIVLYSLILLLLATLVKWEFARFVRGRRKTPLDL